MQEALSRKDYDSPKPVVPVLAPSENDIPQSSEKHHGSGLAESDGLRTPTQSALMIVANTAARPDRPTSSATSQLKSPKVGRASAPGKHKPRRRSAPTHRHGVVSGQSPQQQCESIQAQVLNFQQREDLRNCLLPGMLSRISQKACEGWQRQASFRRSRIMANLKLDICKTCRFSLEPNQAPVRS